MNDCNLEPLLETPNLTMLEKQAELNNAHHIAENVIEKYGIYRDHVQLVRFGTGLENALCFMYYSQIIGTFSSNIAQREGKWFIDSVFHPKANAASICGKINAQIERLDRMKDSYPFRGEPNRFPTDFDGIDFYPKK
jgi:hypothetical protein